MPAKWLRYFWQLTCSDSIPRDKCMLFSVTLLRLIVIKKPLTYLFTHSLTHSLADLLKRGVRSEFGECLQRLTLWRPLLPYMGTAIKHPVPVPDRVKPSFVIFDIRALWRSALSVRVPGCQKLQMTAWHGLARDALYLYPYGNSGRQRVKHQCFFVD